MGTFKEQTKRLEKLYGFHPTQVLTGKDVFKTLVDETQKHSSITSFAFFGHGDAFGLYPNVIKLSFILLFYN